MKKVFFAIVLLFLVHSIHAQDKQTDSLKQLLSATKEDTSTFKILLLISFNNLFSYSDTALLYAQNAMLLANRLKEPPKEAEALFLCGTALSVTGNYPLAIDYLLKGLLIEEQLKVLRVTDVSFTVPLLKVFYYNLSESYNDQGDYEHALYYYNKGKAILTNNVDNALMESSMRLSLIYEKSNQLDSASKYGKKAFDIDVKVNSRSERAPIYITLGNVNYKKKNYRLALQYYRIATLTSDFAYANKDVIDVYNGMAKTFAQTNDIDSGIYYAQKALALRKLISYPLGTLNTYSILADIYKRQGKLDSTVKYFEQTISLRDTLFSQQKEREVQNLSFNVLLRKQEEADKEQQLQNKIKLYSLLIPLVALLIIAFILFRSNRHKQKAYALLQKQKKETDVQKSKVEQTLNELKSAQSQLIQSEKMASLGELTAGIAHEIQNPLNFVNNFSEVNRELISELVEEVDKGNTEEVKAIANDIKDNEEKINHHGKRADAIVKGMMQHSQASFGQKEPTDINKLADEYLRLSYQGLRAKDKSFNATIKTDFDESIGLINIIPQDIGRVLLNLYNNAFYAVAEKKKQNGDSFEPVVSLTTKKIGDKVEISVKDNGNGIPKKIVDKIFQPFFTTKPTGQGTGLGLSLSYDIIKAHGGEIKVETREGVGLSAIASAQAGTNFFIQLLIKNNSQ